jgi:hypothetical protein
VNASAAPHAEASVTRSVSGRLGDHDDALIIQAEMESVIGLTVEQAHRRLATFGHTGKVRVATLRNHDPGCARDLVCSTDHPGGAFVHEEIVLYINRTKLDIAAPPP